MDYKPGDIANGHILGTDFAWRPLPPKVYSPGDIENGHVLGEDLTWHPIPPPPPPLSHQTPLAPLEGDSTRPKAQNVEKDRQSGWWAYEKQRWKKQWKWFVPTLFAIAVLSWMFFGDLRYFSLAALLALVRLAIRAIAWRVRKGPPPQR